MIKTSRPLIAYSIKDSVSVSVARRLFGMLEFNEVEPKNNLRRFECDHADAIELKDLHIFADFLSDYPAEYILFLSKHSSAKGVASFTTHAEGNWSSSADLGGRPHQLSVAAPLQMHQILFQLNRLNKYQINVTYEATHHGPLLSVPSLFVELGGEESVLNDERFVDVVASSVSGLILKEVDESYNKVAIGIGSSHYPQRFTKLALEKGYAFSHIMPRYFASEYQMLQQASSHSSLPADVAVIEWKSINSVERNNIIKELEKLGIDYERI